MVAQGQSSSAKRGGLAADVSSGLIFLQKKKITVATAPTRVWESSQVTVTPAAFPPVPNRKAVL